MEEYKKHWNKSASIIVTAKDDTHPGSSFNYKILTLERLEKSSSYPGATVFPGGIIEKADASEDWLELYKSFGFNIDSFNSINPKENRPRIFTALDSQVPSYLSIRIAAIRETFEETGILLCRSSKVRCEENTLWVNFILPDDLVEWQNKVSNDAREFIKFCARFAMYPDVWSLHEWSNWCSPPNMSKRFDVMIFIAACLEIPFTSMNVHEASRLCWATPQEYLQQYREEKALLLLPQFYEISRLKVFCHIEDLAKFARERACYGTQTFTSHRIFSEDVICSILPGDDLYPPTVDFVNCQDIYLKSIPESKVQHRMYISSIFRLYVVVKNYKPTCNHIAPLSSQM
ncbi:hypothetical protein RN001_016343 [Aquatica leii]|uniref:Nudix hydrolase domain-containing protein n=1 Tax=Aquatica leii TaxID=1421715 RepID=A0AAN7SB97_9COLE|nr:hypothetical protein RN001_016343 [Aquatica leii]